MEQILISQRVLTGWRGMSNKPIKAGDRKQQEKLRMKMERKKKREIPLLPPFIYIATEGAITETAYLSNIVDCVNKRYGKFSRHDRIVLEGYGLSCLKLLEKAENKVERKYQNTDVVWLVYDKDDFPKDDFDNTQFSAVKKESCKYKVAWSNECIELWFLLHFQDVNVNIGREEYLKRLEKHCAYCKTDKYLYSKLKDKTNDAIKRAQKLYDSYPPESAPSAMCPATRFHELIIELQSYLES